MCTSGRVWNLVDVRGVLLRLQAGRIASQFVESAGFWASPMETLTQHVFGWAQKSMF